MAYIRGVADAIEVGAMTSQHDLEFELLCYLDPCRSSDRCGAHDATLTVAAMNGTCETSFKYLATGFPVPVIDEHNQVKWCLRISH
jgi:hypothetical protein